MISSYAIYLLSAVFELQLFSQKARIDLLIQDAMLRFMIQLFNQYRACLIQPTSVTIDHNECFNRKGMVISHYNYEY